jgi:hypothetical protein
MDRITVLDEYIKAEKARVDFDLYYKQTARDRRTGRKVKIRTINANGPEFDVLKPGMVVDELDMSCLPVKVQYTQDTWVWGLTEPVRLVRTRGADEFEIVA